MNSNVLFVKCIDGAHIPQRATPGSAGLDLFSIETKIMEPGEIYTFKTGICVSPPSGTYCRLEMRSSLAKRGLMILGGVIDGDYTGEIYASIVNVGKRTIMIERGVRFIQLVCTTGRLLPCIAATDKEWFAIENKSMRRDGKFGSTGNHLLLNV